MAHADNQKTKIKIAYIIPTLDKGGAERLTVDLILGLDRDIFEPLLVLFKRGGEWLSELTAAGIPVRILEKKGIVGWGNIGSLFSILKEFQPEIVHTHLGGDIRGRLIAKLLHVPVILSTEHNTNRDEVWWRSLLKIITNFCADKIVAISTAVKKDMMARYLTPAAKIVIINNGVPIDKFLPQTEASVFKSAGQNLLFGTIGRLSRQKGHLTLVAACRQLRHTNIEFLVAGVGPLEAEIRRQISAAGLEGRIKLIGQVSDPATFLNSLDAFVFPSLWEGFGIAILEAALAGKPIIASAVDGITDIIDEKSGFLVPAGDAVALARQIDWLADNLQSAGTQAKIVAARAKVIQNFSLTACVSKYQDIYLQLLKKKGRVN